MTKSYVTKESLTALVTNTDQRKQITAIGRALVVILNNQTMDEQQEGSTKESNGIGFTGADAHSGTITAKYYLKHGTLRDFQIKMWTAKNSTGTLRVCKYWKQLNDAAIKKHGG